MRFSANLEIKNFETKDNKNYTLTGNLTIKGIKKPVSLKAKAIGKKDAVANIVADLEFDRTEFDIRYGSGKFFTDLGDKMISDKVQVKVNLKPASPINLGQL